MNLPAGWDGWDVVRFVNAGLAFSLVAVVLYRLGSRWGELSVEQRFTWEAVALFAGATGYAAVDLIGDGVPGSERLVFYTIALVFGHYALHVSRRWQPFRDAHRELGGRDG